MPLVSTTVSNLITGVSQQPAPQRLRTSGEEMINAYPSVVAGLQKRPSTELVAPLNSTIADNDTAAMHIIDRDAVERYIIVAGSGDLEVFDVDGNSKTVNFPDGKSYLPTTEMWKKLRFVTVADTTFILNNEVQTATLTEAETRPDPSETASVFVKRAVASTTYAVYVDGVLAAEFATSDNTTASTALEGTADIADGLKTSAISKGYTDASVVGTTLTFSVPAGAKLAVLDQFGGAALETYTDRIQAFNKLPPSEKEGRMVRIKGNLNDATEDYWVMYEDGVWVETAAYNNLTTLDPDTMPHVLISEADGTFTFKKHTWDSREAGDDNTNPDPSFVGQNINSMFLYKGRLGMLSGENLIMSKTGKLEQFYRTTVVQVFDSDRIDVASITGRVNDLQHAATFSDTLILFSETQQFKVTSQDVLSPKTVGIVPSTKFACSKFTAPEASGPIVYFVTDGATHSTMRELYIDEDLKTIDADEITVQIPSYIPNEIRTMSVSTYDSVMVCLSALEPSNLYIYKWYSSGGEKVQSSWSRWEFSSDIQIVGVDFLEDYMYMVYKMNGQLYLDRMFIDTKPTEDVLLDHRVYSVDGSMAVTYDSGTDKTRLTVPYDHTGELEFYRMDGPIGDDIPVTKISGSVYEFDFDGDYTSWTIQGGVPYTFMYQFSNQYIREDSPTGEAAVQEGRLQIRYMSLIYMDTSYFRAEVTPVNNQTFVHPFTARVLSDADNVLGVVPRDTGEFRFPVFAQNDKCVVKIINDKAFPCAFGSMEWTGMYVGKSQRI